MRLRSFFNLFLAVLAAITFTSCGGGDADGDAAAEANHHYVVAMSGVV